MLLGRGASPRAMSWSTATSCSATNGRTPVRISKRTTPSAKTSLRADRSAGQVDLLRRHIGELALELAAARRLVDLTEGLGDPEVDDLHRAVSADEDVLRRDVAVDDRERSPAVVGQLVRGMEAGGGVGGDARGDRRRERFGLARHARPQDALEGLSVDPLHHQVDHAVLLAEVEDLDDVAVTNLRGEVSLVEEHPLGFGVRRDARAQRLDRDDLAKAVGAFHPRRLQTRPIRAFTDRRDQLRSGRSLRPGPTSPSSS